jgi:hypothetical protein
MLLHLPHFCNSLFALPLMTWPEHGARSAAGLWRRYAAWSARRAYVPPGRTRRIPGCVPQHASPAIYRRVPTSTRQRRRAPRLAPRVRRLRQAKEDCHGLWL